ncbi:hypothetical protein HK405_003969, partial [Cladochytrium tenue]
GRTNPIALRLRGLINWPSNVRHPLLAAYVEHLFQGLAIAPPAVRASTTGVWINVTVFTPPRVRAALADLHAAQARQANDSASSANAAASSATALPSSAASLHPKLASPVLDFASVRVRDALGRGEQRLAELSSAFAAPTRLAALLRDPRLPRAVGLPRRRDFTPANAQAKDPAQAEGTPFDAASPLLARAAAAAADRSRRTAATGVADLDPAALEPWLALDIHRPAPIHLQINAISNPVLDARVLARYIASELRKNRPLPRIYKSILSHLG